MGKDDLQLEILRQLVEVRNELARVRATNEVLLQRVTDVTHLTFKEVAQLLGIGRTAAWRRFRAHAETIPGTRKQGIPIDKLGDAWVPSVRVEAARRREAAAR